MATDLLWPHRAATSGAKGRVKTFGCSKKRVSTAQANPHVGAARSSAGMLGIGVAHTRLFPDRQIVFICTGRSAAHKELTHPNEDCATIRSARVVGEFASVYKEGRHACRIDHATDQH